MERRRRLRLGKRTGLWLCGLLGLVWLTTGWVGCGWLAPSKPSWCWVAVRAGQIQAGIQSGPPAPLTGGRKPFFYGRSGLWSERTGDPDFQELVAGPWRLRFERVAYRYGRESHDEVRMPLWAPTLLAAIPTALLWWLDRRARRRDGRGRRGPAGPAGADRPDREGERPATPAGVRRRGLPRPRTAGLVLCALVSSVWAFTAWKSIHVEAYFGCTLRIYAGCVSLEVWRPLGGESLEQLSVYLQPPEPATLWFGPGPGAFPSNADARVLVPLWMLLLLLAAATAAVWRDREPPPGHCRCGYDLRGLAGRCCPECGREPEDDKVTR